LCSDNVTRNGTLEDIAATVAPSPSMTKAIGNAQQISVPVEANSASQVRLFSWVSIVIGDKLRSGVHSIVWYWRSSANRRSRSALPITDTKLNDIAAAAIIGLRNNADTGKRAGHAPF
jgi:hypothetical protein